MGGCSGQAGAKPPSVRPQQSRAACKGFARLALLAHVRVNFGVQRFPRRAAGAVGKAPLPKDAVGINPLGQQPRREGPGQSVRGGGGGGSGGALSWLASRARGSAKPRGESEVREDGVGETASAAPWGFLHVMSSSEQG